MTFPTIQTIASGTGSSTNSTTATITMPSGINVGDYLLCVAFSGVNTAGVTASIPGWTTTFNGNAANQNCSVLWRIADGTEGASATLTWTSTSGRSNFFVYRMTGCDNSQAPAVTTQTNASSVTQANPALTPSWGALDTQWFAAIYNGNSFSQTVSTYPASSSNQTTVTNSGNSGTKLAMCTLQVNTATETPGSWTMSVASAFTTMTIGIKPTVAVTNFFPNLAMMGI